MPNETPAIPSPSPSAPGIFARVRAWFAAALATVKAAAAPQVQQGTDLVDTAPPLVDAPTGWLGKVRAALGRAGSSLSALRKRAAAWLAEMGRVWPVGWIVWVAALLIGIVLLAIYSDKPDLVQKPIATQSAATQANPLTPLIARIAALEARVDALQTPAPTPPAARQRVQRAAPMAMQPEAAPAPYSEPQPDPSIWGATDLDRAIDTFTPPTTFGARP